MIGILVDVTRCTGCNQCIEACTQANGLETRPPSAQSLPDGISSQQWAAIVRSPEGRFVRKFCRHCLEPACVSVCPVGAMVKTPSGPVIYHSDLCMGCRYCMMACPYGIPRYEWESNAPLVRKCSLCYERLQDGHLPACVEACPEQVMTFGSRDELLGIARSRIQSKDGRYLPQIFGESEFGGTSVLYISDVPLDFLRPAGFVKQATEEPLPALTWNWLQKTPAVGLAVAGLMTGLVWITGRRMLADEAHSSKNLGDHKAQ